MKLCMVGYGAIAERHVEAFGAIGGVEPWALVGRRAEPAAEFASRWKFRSWTLDLDEALADPALEVVVITSPNALHAAQAEKSLNAGKHVLLEIPMALNLPDAERVTRLARRVRLRLMVAHTMRTFPALLEVRRRVEAGELRIYHIVGLFGLPRRSNTTFAGNPRSWTDDLLWHFGAHMVDMALWLTGHREARRLFCQIGPKHPTQNVMDLSLCMTLPGGELVTFAQSFNLASFQWKVTFIGEQTTLVYDKGTLQGAEGEVIVPGRPIQDLRDQNQEFIAAIREGRDPSITGEEVLPAMRILQAAQDSANASLTS